MARKTHGWNSDAIALVCPACKSPLSDLFCNACRISYPVREEIVLFIPQGTEFANASGISSAYDDIYAHHAQVWEDQGRESEFRDYFASLAQEVSTGRLLEIGCGEGVLLEKLNAREKFAVDISPLALRKAQSLTRASCAAAIAEMLPFPADTFDLVVSVGVMEHFLDEDKANAEIRRVLKPGGHYLVLIHVKMTRAQRVKQKVREFVFPRFRPIQLLKWLKKKSVNPIHQPIQRNYTVRSAAASLARSGLVVQRTITLATEPSAPLAGEHVAIYIARRPA